MRNSVLNIFGLGKLPFSASLASLLIIPFYYFSFNYFLNPIPFNCGLFVSVLFWSMNECRLDPVYAQSDPKEVVIDEFLGMHICLILSNTINIYALVILFVAFRIIDIFKIFPFNVIEKKLSGKYGLLWDDIVIGIFIGALCLGVRYFFALKI